MTEENLKRLIDELRVLPSETECMQFETDFAIKDVDEIEAINKLDYPAYFKLTRQPLPENRTGILERLEQERFIQKASLGRYHITNLGAILFAYDLNSFDTLSRKVIRVIFYKANDRLETIKEHRGKNGYAAGFNTLIEYITERLPSHEEIIGAFRQEIKMFPEIAVRELVANALIHQDFTIRGAGPMVEIFADRIEISNPGSPLIDTLRFIDHLPRSRNEKLTDFMRRINICEERGSGIDKVINSIELLQSPAPNFIANENFLKVILYGPKPLQLMDKYDKIRACYQHCSLKFVVGDYMTNTSLRERFNMQEENYRTASKIIADTIAEGLIKIYGPGLKSKKFAKYIPFWA